MPDGDCPLAVVVPTCRMGEYFDAWEAAWKPQFEAHDVELIVVEDKPETWEKLPDFIPYRTGSIRSWGFLQAWRAGYDVITLDDDCRPASDVDLFEEYRIAFSVTTSCGPYFDIGHVFGLGEYMRGYPFRDRYVNHPVMQYGGWDHVPDLDAVTQGDYERVGRKVEGHHFDRRVLTIPRDAAFTGCIMNVAILHEMLPAMYQLVMGIDRVGYDRHDDIWSALFAKKICDHLELPILVNGKASIVHTRASDTASNLAKEQGAYQLNEVLWSRLSRIEFSADDIIGCYRDLTNQLNPEWFGPSGALIIRGMHGWLQALEE